MRARELVGALYRDGMLQVPAGGLAHAPGDERERGEEPADEKPCESQHGGEDDQEHDEMGVELLGRLVPARREDEAVAAALRVIDHASAAHAHVSLAQGARALGPPEVGRRPRARPVDAVTRNADVQERRVGALPGLREVGRHADVAYEVVDVGVHVARERRMRTEGEVGAEERPHDEVHGEPQGDDDEEEPREEGAPYAFHDAHAIPAPRPR